MAEIEIVYPYESYCAWDRGDYCQQCHSSQADELGCKDYAPKNDDRGPCVRAITHYAHKGWSGTNYEIIPNEDPWEWLPEGPVAIVKLGRKTYDCVKVVLNGKMISNNYDKEGRDEANR